MSPRRIQRKREKGWRKPEGAVIVSRPARWGNPYRVGGEVAQIRPSTIVVGMIIATPEVAVAMYRAYVDDHDLYDAIRRDLRDRDLVCWCPLDQPCHADVLLEIANEEPVS